MEKKSTTTQKHRQNSTNIKQTGTGKAVDQKSVKNVCMFTWVDAAAKKAARNEPG